MNRNTDLINFGSFQDIKNNECFIIQLLSKMTENIFLEQINWKKEINKDKFPYTTLVFDDRVQLNKNATRQKEIEVLKNYLLSLSTFSTKMTALD